MRDIGFHVTKDNNLRHRRVIVEVDGRRRRGVVITHIRNNRWCIELRSNRERVICHRSELHVGE